MSLGEEVKIPCAAGCRVANAERYSSPRPHHLPHPRCHRCSTAPHKFACSRISPLVPMQSCTDAQPVPMQTERIPDALAFRSSRCTECAHTDCHSSRFTPPPTNAYSPTRADTDLPFRAAPEEVSKNRAWGRGWGSLIGAGRRRSPASSRTWPRPRSQQTCRVRLTYEQ
jgi:hypothetical protein